MIAEGIVHGQSGYPVAFTLILAALLFLIGLLATLSKVARTRPFRLIL